MVAFTSGLPSVHHPDLSLRAGSGRLGTTVRGQAAADFPSWSRAPAQPDPPDHAQRGDAPRGDRTRHPGRDPPGPHHLPVRSARASHHRQPGGVTRPSRRRGRELARQPAPAVKGLVAKVGGREVFVPTRQTGVFDGDELKLTSPKLDLRRFERRDGEVLLRRDVLGHRLIDVPSAHLIRAADLELRQQWTPDGREEWVLAGVDTRRRPGRLRRLTGRGGGDQDARQFRDWSRFEPLIGHVSSASLRDRWPDPAAQAGPDRGPARGRVQGRGERDPRTRPR